MTLMFGSCERVPIRLSVKPSLRYSLLGSDVALTKGSTAMDVICGAAALVRQYQIPAAATAMSRTTIAAAQPLGIEVLGLAAGDTATDFPDSVSRFSRFRS